MSIDNILGTVYNSIIKAKATEPDGQQRASDNTGAGYRESRTSRKPPQSLPEPGTTK